MIAALYILCTLLVVIGLPVGLFWSDWKAEYKKYKEDKHDQV